MLSMGNAEVAVLYHILGLSYGDGGFVDALEDASRTQLDVLLVACQRALKVRRARSLDPDAAANPDLANGLDGECVTLSEQKPGE
jgi:hypothetical protein